jgi:hypothetical protein
MSIGSGRQILLLPEQCGEFILDESRARRRILRLEIFIDSFVIHEEMQVVMNCGSPLLNSMNNSI